MEIFPFSLICRDELVNAETKRILNFRNFVTPSKEIATTNHLITVLINISRLDFQSGQGLLSPHRVPLTIMISNTQGYTQRTMQDLDLTVSTFRSHDLTHIQLIKVLHFRTQFIQCITSRHCIPWMHQYPFTLIQSSISINKTFRG